jgi:hypothetical protein
MAIAWVTRRSTRAATLAALLAAIPLLSTPAWADKLILFRNGKVLRAGSVKVENGWTLADLGKGNTLGVRSTEILRIEDAGSEAAGPASTPNMAATDGRGVTRSGGGPSHADESEPEIQSSIQERIEQRQQQLEERRNQEAQSQAGVVNPGLRPLTPFNQPAQSRGFRRSRFGTQAPAPGSRAATGDQQIQQREDAQELDEGSDDE